MHLRPEVTGLLVAPAVAENVFACRVQAEYVCFRPAFAFAFGAGDLGRGKWTRDAGGVHMASVKDVIPGVAFAAYRPPD